MLDAASFSRVFKNPQRSRDKFFTVLCRKNSGRDARLGLAIAKKNCRLASGRNRIKRIIRESFRCHRTELVGLDIVILNTPGTARGNNAALFESLEGHWARCQRAVAGVSSGQIKPGR